MPWKKNRASKSEWGYLPIAIVLLQALSFYLEEENIRFLLYVLHVAINAVKDPGGLLPQSVKAATRYSIIWKAVSDKT